ncbi:MAG TPA: ABC transporter ATP-binding protein [Leptospiraceae bacterium]|nr:ABC transporter ATP-binding protein [Leptospiraceae bacterium]HNK99901.1 ABC transporter ATP-binding protein [Leptospiraceae bacterium]HNN58661.1 ABC transporter ATP-binding protein [Leptospiraceae bacterium]HNN76344.1 ABC transporter ATP-binding protein [Leptospiraceae bacterium]HQI19975.1 ABC transporter ATP-binding protein [Leptospiraceae bacterium]
MHPIVIELKGVVKTFRALRAVDGVDLTIRRGEYVGLLGPNGAGKTTLVEMIEGIQAPDDGEIHIFGKSWADSAEELRKRVGLCLQETHFMDKIRVRETMKLFGSFHDSTEERVDEMLGLVNLTDKSRDFVVNLSGGQKQRLALGIALLSRPEILILDEPTTGLDPHARREIWKILGDIRNAGTTLILTTHYMEEAEHLCERIVVMDKGRVLADGPKRELLASMGGETISFRAKKKIAEKSLRRVPGFLSYIPQDGGGRVFVSRMRDALPVFLSAAKSAGITDIECRRSTLDDVFIHMTGRTLDE